LGWIVCYICGTAASLSQFPILSEIPFNIDLQTQKSQPLKAFAMVNRKSPFSKGDLEGLYATSAAQAASLSQSPPSLVGESERIACCIKIVSPSFQGRSDSKQ